MGSGVSGSEGGGIRGWGGWGGGVPHSICMYNALFTAHQTHTPPVSLCPNAYRKITLFSFFFNSTRSKDSIRLIEIATGIKNLVSRQTDLNKEGVFTPVNRF